MNVIKSVAFPGGRTFAVVINDLVYEPVDVIVNAANSGLSHGGGVALAIAQAAGPRLEKEGNLIIKERGLIPVGEAVITTAGDLPFKGVIHAVGPHMGDEDEERKLVKTLMFAFQIADEKGCESISFPGVSSGIYGVPVEICARAYVRAVTEFFKQNPDSPLKTIRLCLFQGPLVEAVKKLIS